MKNMSQTLATALSITNQNRILGFISVKHDKSDLIKGGKFCFVYALSVCVSLVKNTYFSFCLSY